MQDTIATDLKLYSLAIMQFKSYSYFSTMPNPKGNPENLKNFTTDREKPLTEQVNLRVTKEMKEEIQKQDNPPEFCREAIQEKLDRNKEK